MISIIAIKTYLCRKFGNIFMIKSVKSVLVAILTTILLSFSQYIYAGDKAPLTENKEEKFDPAKEIMGHIKDGYEFHFFSIGNFHASIPLPVILYSPQNGWSVFSSSRFGHEHENIYNGYKWENGNILPTDPAVKAYDFSLTKNVVQMLIAMTILVFLLTGIASKYKNGYGVNSAPKGWQNAIEPVVTFIRDEVGKPNLGTRWEKYMPYLLTVFFFILVNTIFGLIPGSANVTGNIAFTIVMGVISFIVITLSTDRYYWKHIFWPHVPHGVKPILIPVEILGIFTKPFALIIRLFANMVAGHIIILSFISLIFIFGGMSRVAGWSFSPISILFTVFIYFIEIMVAFIQAFIFTNLTAVFIGQAFEGSDKGSLHHDEVIL